MKIFKHPFALTFKSTLTVEDVKLLNQYAPEALTIQEPNSDGDFDTVFTVAYVPGRSGQVSSLGVVFSGKIGENIAVSVLTPSNLTEEELVEYINKNYAIVSSYVAVIESQAVQALKEALASKESFISSIVELTESEGTVIATVKEPKKKSGKGA